MSSDSSHLDKIRERFTATADVFAQGVRMTRTEEASRLAERATDGLVNAREALAIDVACGPGTFTWPLAARVRHAVGVDLTPAMVEKARAEAVRDGITNIEFVCADVYALPLADGLVLTEIQKDYEGDTRFPGWDRQAWRVSQKETHTSTEGVRFDFVLYERI